MRELSSRERREQSEVTGVTELERQRTVQCELIISKIGKENNLASVEVPGYINRRHKFPVLHPLLR